MQQVDHLLKPRFARQFVNIVTAIDQFAVFALNVAQAGVGGDDSFQALGGDHGIFNATHESTNICLNQTNLPEKQGVNLSNDPLGVNGIRAHFA